MAQTRRGVTSQQVRVTQAFQHLRIPCDDQGIICFLCNTHFRNPSKTDYPDVCQACGVKYSMAGQYTMPDGVLVHPADTGVKGAIYVNGLVHDKAKRAKKDGQIAAKLREMGVQIFVIKNEEVDNLTQSNLRFLCFSYWLSLGAKAYQSCIEGEKEWGRFL